MHYWFFLTEFRVLSPTAAHINVLLCFFNPRIESTGRLAHNFTPRRLPCVISHADWVTSMLKGYGITMVFASSKKGDRVESQLNCHHGDALLLYRYSWCSSFGAVLGVWYAFEPLINIVSVSSLSALRHRGPCCYVGCKGQEFISNRG